VRRTPQERIAFKQFDMARTNARNRGIPFLLTFDEWLRVWKTSGHWNERGQGKGKFVMARSGDKGSYVIGNIKIITHGENTRERNKNIENRWWNNLPDKLGRKD
jgi:peroxiredoxin